MRQDLGKSLPITVLNVALGANDGVDMGLFIGGKNVAKYQIKVKLVGGTATSLALYLNHKNDESMTNWARAADVGNLGLLGGAALPTDETYVFIIDNIGGCDRVGLVQTGTATVTAEITEVLETGFNRAD